MEHTNHVDITNPGDEEHILSPEEWYIQTHRFMEQAQARADALKAQEIALAKQIKEDEKNLSLLTAPEGSLVGEAGKRLEYIIQKRGLEKSAVAQWAGIGRTTLYRYTLQPGSKSFSVPSKKNLLKILDALSVSVHEFSSTPYDHDAWKKSFEPSAVTGRYLFEWRDEVLDAFAKNNFIYKKGGQTVRLTHAQFTLLKNAVEGALGMLDLLPHDDYGLLAELMKSSK